MGKKDQKAASVSNRYRVIPRVLILLQNGSDVLMLRGAPEKRIWANLYNGVGGHIERGEDILTAAHREVVEETGLDILDLRLAAVVNIDAGDVESGIMMFVFVGRSENRRFEDSDEGKLYWLPFEKLHEYDLVEDLHWLVPRVLMLPADSQPLFLHYRYDDNDQLQILESQKHTNS